MRAAVGETAPDLYAEDDLDAVEAENAEALAKLRAFLKIVWNVALYGMVPAAVVWVLDAARGIDLFSPFVDPAVQARVGRLGLFVGAVAAIIATESLTHLGRPFGLGLYFATVSCIGLAMFPFLAAGHGMALGLAPAQLDVVLSYAYLVLKVGVGVLVGAIMSWILLAHAGQEPPLPPRRTPRK